MGDLANFGQFRSILIDFGKIGQIGHCRDTFWSILIKSGQIWPILVNFAKLVQGSSSGLELRASSPGRSRPVIEQTPESFSSKILETRDFWLEMLGLEQICKNLQFLRIFRNFCEFSQILLGPSNFARAEQGLACGRDLGLCPGLLLGKILGF